MWKSQTLRIKLTLIFWHHADKSLCFLVSCLFVPSVKPFFPSTFIMVNGVFQAWSQLDVWQSPRSLPSHTMLPQITFSSEAGWCPEPYTDCSLYTVRSVFAWISPLVRLTQQLYSPDVTRQQNTQCFNLSKPERKADVLISSSWRSLIGHYQNTINRLFQLTIKWKVGRKLQSTCVHFKDAVWVL